MSKLFTYLICLVLLMSFALATDPIQGTLGTFKQSQSINLIQTCTNSTYGNLTRVILPVNSTMIIDSNKVMTKNGDNYNFSFSNTSVVGRYLVYGNCDENAVKTNWGYDFYITASGTEQSTAQGIIYLVLITINVLLFLICLFGGFTIEGTNQTNDRGLTIPNSKKYLKIFLFFLAYIFLTWLSFNLWNLSLNFLALDFTTKLFKVMADFLIAALLPVTLIMIIFVFALLFIDKNLQDGFNRGLKIR